MVICILNLLIIGTIAPLTNKEILLISTIFFKYVLIYVDTSDDRS